MYKAIPGAEIELIRNVARHATYMRRVGRASVARI
jgi:hypothetical protein